MPSAQINPLLIKHLTNRKETEIPKSPNLSSLPGEYAKLINKQKEKIERFYEENSFMLTCKKCGRKGKYDVGLMVVNTDLEKERENPENTIQTTGYFRCKHCNNAGNWEMPKEFLITSITGMLMLESNDMENKCTIGKKLLHDGSWHLFSSDAETHLLHQLDRDPNNSFIWMRLGNLYHTGARPELAASAFEHCVAIDPSQTEAHYTLGVLLSQIGEYEKSAYHLKQMLLSADKYHSLGAEDLRDLLANGLNELFFIYQHSNGEIPFLPTKEALEAAGKSGDPSGNMEIDLQPGKIESFYPLAEMFMGSQRKRLPGSLRTVQVRKPVKKVKKRHKRTKRK